MQLVYCHYEQGEYTAYRRAIRALIRFFDNLGQQRLSRLRAVYIHAMDLSSPLYMLALAESRTIWHVQLTVVH